MSSSGLLARAVALVGDAAVWWRRPGSEPAPAVGSAPTIPAGKPQGLISTLKMPTAQGWGSGQAPSAAPGLKVNAFATGLKHPRWIQVLPNGDVTVSEAMSKPGPPRTIFGHAMVATMKRAGAIGESPDCITLLRDADGDGVAELRESFIDRQNQPFGMALLGSTFYIGNTDGIMAFDYATGATRLAGPGRRLTTFKPGGHWTRSLLASPDGRKLYAGVGSMTNIAELGLDIEQGRACIVELDLASGHSRIFAAGLRNAVGMAWEPTTGALWTVVNERDGLGDETPPDYALGGHTASLGLCWLPAGTLPGFGSGMVIGQHGSWNRSTLSGYKVIFVPFDNGRPSGPPRDILSGFLAPDESVSYGRPVGVAIGPDGRSVLVADDVGDVLWRVSAA